MNAHFKAIVIKTPLLRETHMFFTEQLGFTVKESSPTHFVIYSKTIRVLFIESNDGMEIELYLAKNPGEKLLFMEDPNHIKIIIA